MIKDTIQKLIYASMKEGKQTEVKVLRFVLSEIKYAEINKQTELTNEEVIVVLQKEIKKRKDAIEVFRKGGRTETIADEEDQIKIIQQFTPKQLPESELQKIIDDVISTNAPNPQMGKIIGMVMAKVKGQAEGTRVSNLVKQRLLQTK